MPAEPDAAATIAVMLLRLRWFLFGAFSSMTALTYLAVQVRRAKRRLAPASLVRSGRRGLASSLDRAADRIDPPHARPG